jgi:hypothetical protein
MNNSSGSGVDVDGMKKETQIIINSSQLPYHDGTALVLVALPWTLN